MYFYRYIRLSHLESDSEKIFQCLNDIKIMHPEVEKEGLKMKKLEEISVECEGTGHLIKDKGMFTIASRSQDVNVLDSEDEIEDMDEPDSDDV